LEWSSGAKHMYAMKRIHFMQGLCLLLLGVSGSHERNCDPKAVEKHSECSLVAETMEKENIENEMNVELLQRDLHLKRRNNFKEITVAPWDCKLEKTSSFQSTTLNDNSASFITNWDQITGTGTPVLTLKPEATSPPFRSLNACEINGNNILYCSLAITNKGTFLVGIDKDAIGFVDKVLEARYSATFDADDNYYVYAGKNDEGRLSVITGVSQKPFYDNLEGLQQYNDLVKQGERFLAVKDYVKNDGQISRKFHLGADLAYFQADLRGKGLEKYFASLTFSSKNKSVSAMKLLVIPCKPKDKSCNPTYPPNPSEDANIDPTPELYELAIISDLPASPEWNPRVWGTAFAKKSHETKQPTDIYFSADDGQGLYSANEKSYDWEKKTVMMNRVGNALPTSWNDGISCFDDTLSPDDTVTTCSGEVMFRSTTVHRKTANPLSSILQLDETTGAVKKTIDLKEKVRVLNACAINPKDHKIYCVVTPQEACSGDDKIARLDTDGNVGYISNFKPGAVAGTFDKEGNYWVFGTNDGLFKFEDAHKMTAAKSCGGFGNNQPVNTIDKWFGYKMKNNGIGDEYIGKSGKQIGSDMEILLLEKRYYIISLPGTEGTHTETFQNRMTMIDITDVMEKKSDTPEDPIILFDTTKTLPNPVGVTPKGQTENSMTWGSAWRLPSSDGSGSAEAYVFADDAGQGYWKLKPETIDTEGKSVKFEKWGGKTDPVEWNNGFSCYTESPKDLDLSKMQ